MKYEDEINEILNTFIPKKSWMTDEDHKEVIEETFKRTGMSKQQLSDDIEVGIKNGYSIKEQVDLLKQVFKQA